MDYSKYVQVYIEYQTIFNDGTHPLTFALATCSGSDAKYGEPLEACNSFCRVHMYPPINAGETQFTRIPYGAKSYHFGVKKKVVKY